MKKTLILDLGNVLIYADFKKFYAKLKSVLGYTYEETMKKMEPFMAEYNKGTISPENFYKQCSKVLKLNIDFAFFSKAWIDIFTPNTELISFLNTLSKENLEIILASNTDVLHYENIQKKNKLKFIDHQFLSYKESVIKPDKSFFIKLLEKYQVDQSNCIFFDDLADNIKSATECNIQAIQHKDNATTIEQIKEFVNAK